jgi:single-stranded-DNA-specific exonuclease
VLCASRPDEAARLASKLGISPVTAQLLVNRNIQSPEEARAFLRPALNDLHDPLALPDAERAAQRLHEAVRDRERIVIYGDYDVDGITATALLVKCLSMLQADVHYYIPSRLEEGYGLNAQAVRKIAAERTGLLLTTDCGVTALDEVRLAKELGMTVIVTDHHQPGPRFAQMREAAHSVVCATRPDSAYPFDGLSGVGVAFKLAWAIGAQMSPGKRCSEEFQKFLLDALALVSLGTIADVVPLLGENRVLASFGLAGLSFSESPGLRELRLSASVDGRPLNAFDVAFKLAPRLNAAGRLGTAMRAVELLTTTSDETARDIAKFLDAENTRRQKIQEKIFAQSREMVLKGPAIEECSAIVLAAEGWHPGVVGVVASKLVEEFWRPAVVLSIEGDEAHGSARSIRGLHLFDALCECESLLTRFGGHARAAGLHMPRKHVEKFRELFCEVAARRLSPVDTVPVVEIEAIVLLSELSPRLMSELEMFEPCGQDNPRPVLASTDLQVGGKVSRIGPKGNHLSFYVRQRDTALRAVAFGMGELADELGSAGACALAYRPRFNDWKGTRQLELMVKEIALGSNSPLT